MYIMMMMICVCVYMLTSQVHLMLLPRPVPACGGKMIAVVAVHGRKPVMLCVYRWVSCSMSVKRRREGGACFMKNKRRREKGKRELGTGGSGGGARTRK
jgi:hypothetical protein